MLPFARLRLGRRPALAGTSDANVRYVQTFGYVQCAVQFKGLCAMCSPL